jgi:polar amino acid transport system substrate-binding protein
VRALKDGRVDAIVVDLPTAFYLTGAEIPAATIAGQFEAPGGDTWGALLEKDSKLTSCVSHAIDQLKSSGELKDITDRWMGGQAGVPTLQ